MESLGRGRRGLDHQREARYAEHRQRGRKDDVTDLALGADLVEEPVSRCLSEQRKQRPLGQAAPASLTVDGERMVFVLAHQPPGMVRSGVEPHDAARPTRVARIEPDSSRSSTPPSALAASASDVAVGEGDDLAALEEPCGVCVQIVEFHRLERREQCTVGPVRIEQELAPRRSSRGERGRARQRSRAGGRTPLSPPRIAAPGTTVRAEPIRCVRAADPCLSLQPERRTVIPRRCLYSAWVCPASAAGYANSLSASAVMRASSALSTACRGEVAGDRGAHREVEIRTRLPEFDIDLMPQIEAGPACDAGGPRLRRPRVDQGQIVRHERILAPEARVPRREPGRASAPLSPPGSGLSRYGVSWNGATASVATPFAITDTSTRSGASAERNRRSSTGSKSSNR